MKRYAARLGLLFGSLLMSAAGNLIALGHALVGSDRAWPVAVANDQTLNAALVGRAGAEDETLSSRAAKAQRAGRRWGCVLCRLLDHLDPGHCDRHIEPDEGERAAAVVAGPVTAAAGTPEATRSPSCNQPQGDHHAR